MLRLSLSLSLSANLRQTREQWNAKRPNLRRAGRPKETTSTLTSGKTSTNTAVFVGITRYPYIRACEAIAVKEKDWCFCILVWFL
jgi:hypothetical protein